MASTFKRNGNRWYARFKDEDGVWRARRVRVETRSDAMRIAKRLEAKESLRQHGLESPESVGLLMGELLRRWESGLTNRSAYDDRSRLRKWITPKWERWRLGDVTISAVQQWAAELTESTLSAGTRRHLLAVLSRFFSWAIDHGFSQTNPVRLLPAGVRPRVVRKDVDVVSIGREMRDRLFEALPAPANFMFFVGITSGCRLMEIAGLRLSDLDELAAGTIRVRYSGLGPLKEDRRGVGKVKFVPAAPDAAELLAPWLEQRRAAGAGPEDLVFVKPDGRLIRKDWIAYRWRRAARAVGVSMTWDDATRKQVRPQHKNSMQREMLKELLGEAINELVGETAIRDEIKRRHEKGSIPLWANSMEQAIRWKRILSRSGRLSR